MARIDLELGPVGASDSPAPAATEAAPAGFRLRPVNPLDLERLYEFQRHRASNEMSVVTARRWDDFQEYWNVKIFGNPHSRAEVIEIDGQVAGHLLSWNEGQTRVLGYWLGHRFWGRGHATRALRLFVAGETHWPVFAQIATHNHGSARVAEKAGFRRVEAATVPAIRAEGFQAYVYRLDGPVAGV